MRTALQSSVIVAVLGLLLLTAPSVYGNACSGGATGNWSAPGTWTSCGGVVPTSADTVEINSGATVTVDVANAVAASIRVGGVVGSSYGLLVFDSGSKVTVSGTVTLGGSSLRAGTITMTAGGTLTAGALALGVGAATWTPGTGTVELTATNTLPAAIFTSFNNLIITGGTTTLGVNVTISSDLTVTAGTLYLNTFTANRGTSGGTLTVADGATLKIGGTNGFPTNYSVKALGAISTVEYSGTAQAVGAQNYGHLTLSNSGLKTFGTVPASNIRIAGALTISGTATTDLTTNTTNVSYNGSGAQTINALTYYDLTASTSGTKTLAGNATVNNSLTIANSAVLDLSTFTANRASAGGTLTLSSTARLKIGGTNTFPSNYSTHVVAATTTIEYSGTTQSVIVLNSSQNYGNLTISGSGTKTLAATISVAGDLTVSAGTFDLGSFTANRASGGGTLSIAGGATLKIGGTNTIPSNFTTHSMAGVSAIEYSGTNQSVVVLNSAQNYQNLTISGSGTKTLAGDVNVAGTLTLSNGIITTGASTVYVKNTGTVIRVSGYVIGNLKRFIATGSPSRTFDVGDATNYTPVTVAFASVTTGGDLTVSVAVGDHANIGTSTINTSKSVNRNWTLTNTGIVFASYGATFTFVAGDVDAGANTANFIVGKYSGGAWTYPTVGTKTGTTTQATGLTAFSDFQIGELAPPTYSISGTVFEDKNYGGGAGRSLAASSGAVRPGARVELFDSGGTYQTFATTDGSGSYTFSGLVAGTYTVRVVNASVTTSRGVMSGTTPAQTFRTDASSGTAVAVTDHVGGEAPGLLDAVDGSTTLAALTTGTLAPQSITSVALSSGNISGVDFGYSFNVIVNANNSGQGSLRRFLNFANAISNTGLAQSGLTAGIDNAVFMLADGTAHPGLTASYPSQFVSGVATIALTSSLPTISDPIVLDATLQPGYTSVPMIELNGTSAGAGISGLAITAGGSTVRGFAINRFTAYGISLSTTGGNTIAANFLGTNATGTAASANTTGGINLSSSSNTIGGTTAATRNIISGNGANGIDITGSSNIVQGNYVGTNAAGTGPLANSGTGVYVSGSAASNTIGGTAAGAGNLVSRNTGKGVVIAAGTGNAILSNSIYANTGIGIDLANDGVTANNGTKSGALPNFDMDTPVFSTTTLVGTTLTLSGYVGAAAGQATFAGASVQVFKADNDASGFGEGQTFLGTLTTDASGNFSGTLTVSLAIGDKITATATDATNNTSEFGANSTVADPPVLSLVNSVTPSGTQPPSTDLVYTVAFTNGGGQAARFFTVVDPIPAHTDFKLGSASTVLGTTGLTVAVEYSNDNAVTWTYTPVSGGGGALANYDRAVTHVRWTFTGNLSQNSPNNAGSVSLTSRIR